MLNYMLFPLGMIFRQSKLYDGFVIWADVEHQSWVTTLSPKSDWSMHVHVLSFSFPLPPTPTATFLRKFVSIIVLLWKSRGLC